jgi:hypothetical protein
MEMHGETVKKKDICSCISSPRLIKSWINWVRQVACMGETVIADILVIFVERLEGI